jgi:adenylate cyclase, class 1
LSVIDPLEALTAFQRLNRTRIERLSTLLPQKAHFFLDLLPLLFQTNDPMLPGFISQATPAGIVAYQPNNAVLDSAKTINHAFNYKRHSLPHYPLRGLYLINDNGLLNYHADVKFDLWLVYADPITLEQLELLQQKITAICDWAYSFLQIKLNSRLLNEQDLNIQIATSDLDRFYANGLVLAGQTPSWWAVPPASQTALTSANQNDALDFGSLISKENNTQSLLNQSLEIINNAMDSNLEFCLSLIFRKIQLKQYPDFLWLSDLLKQAVYAGITDPMLLDNNQLKLNYITTFCSDAETVFIAQQSFYIQCRERLSKTVNLALYPWRRTFIEAYYQSWNWPPNTIQILDKRDASRYRQSLTEYQNVRLQITNAMQSAFLYAQQHKINIEVTKQKLIKKFKILFESELDIIDALPSSFKPKSAEQQLYLARTSLGDSWQINDLPATFSTEPLYQHPSLLNVLAWAVNNQLLTKASALQFVDQRQKIKIGLVLDLIQQLLQSPIQRQLAGKLAK